MQETTFPVEIIIRDDASTDGTSEIVKSYAERHPEIIRPIFLKENQFSKGKKAFPETFAFVRGKYIALCEGDDFWTNPLKLQKQVFFLEQNLDYSLVFHNAEILNTRGSKTVRHLMHASLEKHIFNTEDILRQWFIPTASIVFRKYPDFKLPEWFYNSISGDIPLQLLLSLKGLFRYINEPMSVYRLHPSGLSLSHDGLYKVLGMIYIYENFNLHTSQKYKQRIFEAILFEIKYHLPNLLELDFLDTLNLKKQEIDTNYIAKKFKHDGKISFGDILRFFLNSDKDFSLSILSHLESRKIKNISQKSSGNKTNYLPKKSSFHNSREKFNELENNISIKEKSLYKSKSKESLTAMKLLFVSHEASRTGAPICLLNYLRWLKNNTELSFDILLLRGGSLESEFARLGNIVSFDEISSGSNSHRYDLAFVNTICCIRQMPVIRSTSNKLVTYIHELDSAFESVGPLLASLLVYYSDHFVCCAKNVAEKLHELLGVPRNRILIHPEMIDFAIDANASQLPHIFSAYNIKKSERIVLMCGTVDVRKGADLFLRVAHETKKILGANENFRFMWLGRNPQDAFGITMLQETKKLGLEDKVIWAGESSDVLSVMRASSVFCLTSREDPMPLVMLEAAGVGLPIVAFDRTGGAEEFCASKNGFLAPYGNIYEMARLCAELISKPESAAEFIANAQNKVKYENFTSIAAPRLHEAILSFITSGERWYKSKPEIIAAFKNWTPAMAQQYLALYALRQNARIQVQDFLSKNELVKASEIMQKVLNRIFSSNDQLSCLEALLEFSMEYKKFDKINEKNLLKTAGQLASQLALDVNWFMPMSIDEAKTILHKINALKNYSEDEICESIQDTRSNNFYLKNNSEKKEISNSILGLNVEHIPSEHYVFKGKRLLVFSDEPGQGGGAHYAHSILLALAKSGAEVFSAQPQWESPLLEEQKNLGIKHVWTAFNPVTEFGRSLTDMEDPSRILDQVQPDVILFSDCCPVSHVAAKNAAMDRLIPFVTTCHIDAPYLADRFKGVLGMVEKQYAYASALVAVSSSVLEMLRQKFGVDRSQGRVIYNGRADRFFMPPDNQLRLKLRAEIGVSEDAVICFTAARMVNEKGHIFQIEAANRLRDRGKLGNLHFVWAGEGNLTPQLKEIVHKERLDDRFHFLGYRWDIEDWLSAADIFVLSSQLEAFPLCVIEAMAKGLPVVASAVAGVPEEMGNTGALLPDPNKDPQGAIAKLMEVLGHWAGNGDIRKQVGALAKERASKLFREEEMCRQTLALLSQASALGVQELAVRKMNAMLRSGEATEILKPFRTALEKTVSKDVLGDPDLPSFPPQELNSIKSLIQTWNRYPTDESAFEGVRELRRGVASCLVNLNDQSLPCLFSGSFGEVYRILLSSGVQEYVSEEELSVANALLCGFNENGDFALSRLMASMLFRPAYQTTSLLAIEALPNWFRKDFWNYTLSVPQVLTEPEEALKYSIHLLTWLREAVRRIEKEPTSPFTKEIASTLMQHLNVIPSYCTPEGNGELMKLRARVIEFTLGNSGLKLDMLAQLKGQRRAGQKIRVGVLNSHFGLQTETFVTLPALHLDKDRFEVHLFCGVKNPGLVEDRCRSLVKGFHLLPESIQERVQMIRNAKLDVLIIGTNITAVTNQIALLAAFRMAPIQVVSHCSPMTSGFKNSDAFLSGSLAYREGVSEAEFSEKLILLDGPPVCLDYSSEPAAPGLVPPDRSQIGIPADAVVFFNAASCYKIPLELLHLWARLLNEVPNSLLCLLPFNPNWASNLPEARFRALLESVLAEHGVDKKRVVIGPKLPNRAAVMNFERIADVYLDTLPFSGSISTVDPLQLGIPVVACDGETTRSRCSGAQLRELGLDELVGQNEEEYFAKALHLARDQEYRSSISSRIKQAMSKRPRFLNPVEYGRNLGDALEVLVQEGLGALDDPKAFAQKVRDRRLNSSGDSGSEAALSEMTLSDAQAAFSEGRLSDAEDICREILGKDERCAGAWHLMGKMAALQGDLETAGEFVSVACDLDPQNADFVRESAEVFFQKKELDATEQQVRRALEMAPDSPEGLVLLGRILAEKDDRSGSLEAFQDALRLRKDYAEGFSQYATALQKFGRGKDAISQIRKACALEPDSVEFQTNLAILLEQNARYVDALAAYGKASRLNPNVGFVWFRQGKLLNGLKRYAEAIPVLEKAISLPGQLGDYHYEYGLALHMSKRFQEALVNYEKALSMGYETAALHCNRGVIYKDLRKGGDSIMAFHKAVTMDPSNVSYLNNLGAAALELGLNSEALDCFEQAVEKNPKLPTARNNIGNLLKDRARGMDALPQYRKSMELNPDDRDAPSNYLLCHMYIPDMDPKLVFEEHKKWGISTTKKFPPAFKFKPREAGAKIRVGFLSADLCHHPVAHFIEPIFRGYDRERFEFVAYGDQRKSDEFSARFAKQVDLWRETSSYDDLALAKLIYEDRVDILFELAGHTAYNRLGVFALKPAPLLVSYLGYPGTTGLPTIDFRITDAFADPQGTTEHLHTEKLIRVPECAWCFEPDAVAPEVEPLPALKNGYVTFGCFNNMAKLNPALFETWAEILLRVPGSHLRLKARTLTDDGVRKELKSYFTERGIEEDRLDFFGHTKKIADHLGSYHSVDIALDSFPYHGTTTTCEAMWMGCPVVTRAGKTHVSRVGVSLLSAVGLQEFITDTREDYIEKAVALAGQTDRLEELRAGMRERIRQSVLMDEKRFVRGFEKALLEMATLGGLVRS